MVHMTQNFDITVDQGIVKTNIENVSSATQTIVHFFSEQSGMSVSEVMSSLGGLSQYFDMPFEEALDILIPIETEQDQRAKLAYLDFYKRGHVKIPETQKLPILWRDVFTYAFLVKPGFQAMHERLRDVIAGNAYSRMMKSYKLLIEQSPQIQDVVEKNDHLARELRDDKQEIRRRAELVQKSFEQAREVCLEIYKRGNYPILRTITMKTDEQKDAFIQNHPVGSIFIPQGTIPLETLTLNDVASHTQARTGQQPLESWTYLTPSSPWRYGQAWFGRTSMILLVSEVTPQELIWGQVLNGARAPREEWSFKISSDKEAITVSNSTSLAQVKKDGKKAAAVPTEGEVTVWSPLQILGIFDLGPNQRERKPSASINPNPTLSQF
jgi:hypothetical protein